MRKSTLLLSKALGLAALLGILSGAPARAQTPVWLCLLNSNPQNCPPISAANPLPVSATVTTTATVAGFAPGGAYANINVSAVTSNVGLPAGTAVNIYNTGSNPAFVKLGTSGAVTVTPTTGDQIAPGGFLQVTVGSNTFLAAITASSS